MMDILVIPVNETNLFQFYNLFDIEEFGGELRWKVVIKNNLKVGSFVFFPELNKIVRAYKVMSFKDDYVILSIALADFLWKDWNYVANKQQGTLSDDPYIISGEKTKAIYNFFHSKLNEVCI